MWRKLLIIVHITLLVIALNVGSSLAYANQCSGQLSAPVSPVTFTTSGVLVTIPVSVTCPTAVGDAYVGAAATDTSNGASILAQGDVLTRGESTYSGSVILRFASSESQGDSIQITALIYTWSATNGLGTRLATASENWKANFGLPNSTTSSSANGICNPSTDGACCPYGAGYSNFYCPGYVNNGAGCLYPEGTPFYEMPGICPSSTPPPACPYNYYYSNGYCYPNQEQIPLCSRPTAGLIMCFPSTTGQQYCYQTNVGVYSCYPYANQPNYYYPYYYQNPQKYYYPCYLSNGIYYCYRSK